MSKNELVPRHVSIDNGEQMRWVTPDDPSVATDGEALSLLSDPFDYETHRELYALHDELNRMLNQRPSSVLVNEGGTDVTVITNQERREVSSAFMDRKVTLLRAFKGFAPSAEHRLSTVRRYFDMLLMCDFEDPTPFMTPNHLKRFQDMWDVEVDILLKNRDADPSGVICLAVTANEDDWELIEQIIRDRVPTSVAEAQALLDAAKVCSGLTSGVL